MMEAVLINETSVYFNLTTQRYSPESCHLHLQISDRKSKRWRKLHTVRSFVICIFPKYYYGEQTNIVFNRKTKGKT
jgi:hypothetical protein